MSLSCKKECRSFSTSLRKPLRSTTRDRIGLSLKGIVRTRSIKVRFGHRRGETEEHQLCRFVDGGTQLDGNLPEIHHLERDRRIETGIDLGCCHVNRDADSRPATPAFDETDEVGRNGYTFERLRKDEASGHQPERVGLDVLPQ